MKPPQIIRNQTAILMWDWIWPIFFLQSFFSLGIVIGPHLTTSTTGVIVALVLLGVAGYFAYEVRFRHQLARRWFFFVALSLFNMVIFITVLAIRLCFQLGWPEDLNIVVVILVGLAATAGLTWHYYTPILHELHTADCRTGRFNLQQGTYSFRILPTFYEFKTPFLRKVTNVLLPYSSILIGVSAALGVLHRGKPLRYGYPQAGMGLLFLFIAFGTIAAATAAFYTYRFIRRWEKQTGRTMWIEGFEPGAPTE